MATKTKPIAGTVKWYAVSKGYGFITGDDGIDYFVHQSEIQMEGFRKLKSDQKVTFTPGERENKPVATVVNF